jgi:hypothetical protein
MSRSARRAVRVWLALVLIPVVVAAQPPSPVDHAKDVFARLNKQDFKGVTAEFNAEMAAAISESQLRELWTAMSQQTGSFKAFIDDRVSTPSPGTTGVILGCQFEHAAVNMAVAFDANGKISGLRLMPRQ